MIYWLATGFAGPECRANQKLHHGKGNWLAVSIMVLSVYSTLLSGLWLGVAIAKPRFGHGITNNSRMTPATASLVAAAIAKSIELSFVTVFITFLGQVLSRRALIKRSRGITISEMSMRQWVSNFRSIYYPFLRVSRSVKHVWALFAPKACTSAHCIDWKKECWLRNSDHATRHDDHSLGDRSLCKLYFPSTWDMSVQDPLERLAVRLLWRTRRRSTDSEHS